MTCEGTPVGHCLIGETQSACCPELYDVYGELGGSAPVPTGGRHPECFVGIPGSTAGDWGGDRGPGLISCGVGCWTCKDYPHEIHQRATEYLGKRFLMSDPTSWMNRDARGNEHDIQSSTPPRKPHLVPLRAEYMRGTCRTNFGEECFGLNVCACYGDNAANKYDTVGNPGWCDGSPGFGTVPYHDLVLGYWADEGFASGWGWPMNGQVGGVKIGNNQLACRRFQDTLGRQNERAIVEGRPQWDMPQPALLRYSGPCTSNALVGCSAWVGGAEGECYESFQALLPCGAAGADPFLCRPSDTYNDGTRTSVRAFDELWLFENTAHVIAGPNARTADVDFKNRVLLFARRTPTPFTTPPPNGTTFDRLTHRLVYDRNAGLSLFDRYWDGTDLDLIARPAVDDVFGDCVTATTRYGVTCSARVHRVHFGMIFVPELVRSNEVDYVYPHARMRMLVELSIHAEFVVVAGGGLPFLSRPWLDPPDDRVDLMISYEDESGNPLRVPRVVEHGRPNGPTLDRIRFHDPAGKIVDPSVRVDWMGYAGAMSSEPYRPGVQRQANDLLRTLECMCAQMSSRTWSLEGWPSFIDTRPDAPAMLYGGHVRFGFNGSASFCE